MKNITNNLISKQQVDGILKVTQDIISEVGPRLAGTPQCKKAAEIIYSKIKKYCDFAEIEKFTFHRDAFLSFMKILAITYIIFLICMFVGGVWIYIGTFFLFAGAVITIGEFVFYKEIIDIFFKKMTGYNVIGKIEPQKEVKQNIIISSHHDSAYVFRFFKKFQKLYAPRIALGIITYFSALIFSIKLVIYQISAGTILDYATMKYIFLAGSIFVIQFYFFRSKKVSYGAGDDLVGSVIGIKLAEIFGQAKKDGKPLLEHTRLTIVSFDAEESGLRGAKNYVRRHKKELLSIPTFNFNIDNIYNLNELSFLTSDINGTVKLSKNMTKQCMNIAEGLGYKITSAPITFGGGATDAGEFAKIGVEAITLIGMENKIIRDNLVYHTINDIVDKIEPDAVLACLKIVTQYILLSDKKTQEKNNLTFSFA